MDWNTCIREKNVKQVIPDTELANSLLKTSKNKIFSSKSLELRQETTASKISLAYDSVRELLEAIAMFKGFKIYNHICYTAFLKESSDFYEFADTFDELRQIRNDINYYGKELSTDEAKIVIDRLEKLRKEIIKRGNF